MLSAEKGDWRFGIEGRKHNYNYFFMIDDFLNDVA